MKIILTLALIMITQISFSQQSLTQRWQSDTTLRSPESVWVDSKNKVLYVSNTVNFEQKGKGFISKLDMDGKFIKREWVTGLDAVLGIGIYKNLLYAAEANSQSVAVIDIKKASIIKRIAIAGAGLLNDITVDSKGIVYVSDTKNGKVYRIENDQPSLYLENLKGVNGLLAVGKELYVLSDRSLIKVDPDKQMTVLSKGMEGGLDGVVQVKTNEFLVSGWQGLIYHVKPDGSNEIILDTRENKVNAADIGYDKSSGILYIPTVRTNMVHAYKLN
ncbi:ATP/GTP-binding protein [Sphingobacterium sp. HMA12]|uniref:ATP/GTP-binding protein n=1 Tax=Sphingobacterium sp. HMA12 TaxID=2050894 RepID=UPI00131507AE|nr:ATP/GTP-binding protein [Sphingobacterium sp. HMA12]